MVSYQLFTQIAVTTVTTSLNGYIPYLGAWLTGRVDMIVFIYAFAWVFVLSSIIPQIILGKERSVFIQFLVCLIITLTAFVVIDVVKGYGYDISDPTTVYSSWYGGLFSNPIFAAAYLSVPYIFMLTIDWRGRKKKKQKEKLDNLTDNYLSNTIQNNEKLTKNKTISKSKKRN